MTDEFLILTHADANLTSLQQPLQLMVVQERNDSIKLLQLPPPPNAKPDDANSSSSGVFVIN